MKRIEVVAALIVKEGRVFATQRGYGPWKDWWEFPGGKMEPGESREDALRREIAEELSCSIIVGRLLDTVEWDYPEFHLTMHCFSCRLTNNHVTLLEHEAAKWLAPAETGTVKWLPADKEITEALAQSGKPDTNAQEEKQQNIMLQTGDKMPQFSNSVRQTSKDGP